MPPDQQSQPPIDLNILPEQYRRRVVSPIIMLFWVIAIALFVLCVPTFIFQQYNRRRAGELSLQLSQAQSTLRALRTPGPTVVALSNELERKQRALEALQTLQPTLAMRRNDWPSIFETILSYDPQHIDVRELIQDVTDLRLGGLATSQDEVLNYANFLDRSGVFQQVIVQSIERATEVPPPETPGVTATGVPTGVVATPTPVPPTPTVSPYDVYEIDDFAPKAIVVGEVQRHNFYPLYDADEVAFLGKAGRRYCIQAVPQSLGVDTYLEVTVCRRGYVNDDCTPNELTRLTCECPTGAVTATMASLVEVQVPDCLDTTVRVRVTNRGVYGPDKWYHLLVYEPMGDPWEKDDDAPKAIAVGEAQRRTFYPEGDIDRVTFPVKDGHAYQVRTSDLALGVDTTLDVIVGGNIYENDDVAVGDLSSQVTFQADVAGVAYVRVTNKGEYGVDQSYILSLYEVGSDAYEPDDVIGRPISPYEEQRHTFFPEGDIDRLEFNVKAGRIYELKTYSLTIGVDTALHVWVDSIEYYNDDATPPYPASRVVFTAKADGRGSALVVNRERYGAYREYWISFNELVPTATPTTTLPTTTPAPTATPDCGDEYEPDDAVARIMVVGETQTHTFCPAADVDRVVFTAKAGYAYLIETTNLASGVDTFLTAQLGGTTLDNDDRSPQDLGSSLQIQNLTGTDAPAFITVMNKGLFGEDKSYDLSITNVGAGDQYEVDDVVPAPIGFGGGGQQEHSFYPPGDVDRLSFVAKVGHRYAISTTNLANLVDTVLTVDMGATHLVNDDVFPGALSSYVEIQNDGPNDSEVLILVTNKGQYGPEQRYTIQVTDLGAVSGDQYEPDLTAKRYLSLNEIQRHTFHPDLDVDRVWFKIKAGRRYRLRTCGTSDPTGCAALLWGVDTVVVVAGPIANCYPSACQNDDELPGSGYLNSMVEFDALVDGEVTITLYNQGLFGPEKEYYVTVRELGAAPPTPAGPTPTPYFSPTPTRTPTPVPPPTPTPTSPAYAPPGATVTPTPSAAPPPAPTATATASAYPAMRALSGRHRVTPENGQLPEAFLAPVPRALLKPPAQAPPGGPWSIRFVLLLKMKRVTP